VSLGDLQQVTMLAVARLGKDAFGQAIRQELQAVADRELSVSAIYVTLLRLEEQGLVTSESAAPDPARGGRGKRFFRVTRKGWAQLRAARASMDRLWQGLERA